MNWRTSSSLTQWQCITGILKGKKWRIKKIIWRNNRWKLSKFDENNPINPGSSTNPKYRIMKKTRPKHIIITLLKTTGRENLKRNHTKKDKICGEGQRKGWRGTSHEKQGKWEESRATSFKILGKKKKLQKHKKTILAHLLYKNG